MSHFSFTSTLSINSELTDNQDRKELFRKSSINSQCTIIGDTESPVDDVVEEDFAAKKVPQSSKKSLIHKLLDDELTQEEFAELKKQYYEKLKPRRSKAEHRPRDFDIQGKPMAPPSDSVCEL